MSRLVLLDRDGTINVDYNYLSHPDQLKLFPQTADAIRIFHDLNLLVIVVTNQSAVGRGYFDLKRLYEIHDRLYAILRAAGTTINAIYFCPHSPKDNCHCRKPSTKMAEWASKDFDAELSKSFVIGDNVCDIQLGKNISATTVLVRTGHGAQVEQEKQIIPDYIVENLFEAACLIKGILNDDTKNNQVSD